jgi:hypothetical protein
MQNTHTLTLTDTYHPANPLRSLLRAFNAEILKVRRTLALRLTLIAPLVIAILQMAISLDEGQRFMFEEGNAWLFITRQALVSWALLMQPLFITLETALIAQLDHSGDHWRHLFALPLPRWSVYTAKLLVCALLTALSLGALLFYSLLFGALLRQVRPGPAFDQPIPLIALFKLFLLVFVSSGLLVSVHTWTAHYWRSFTASASFGVFMTIAGMLVINSGLAVFYPWTHTAVLLNRFANGLPYLPLLGAGCLVATAITLVGGFLFTRRDVL